MVLIGLVLGCGDGGGPSDNPPEDLGTPVSPEGEVTPESSQLAWSVDDAEIFYSAPVAPNVFTVKAIRVSDGVVRVVDGRERFRFGLTVGQDGSLYVASAPTTTDPPSLERLSADGKILTTIATHVLVAPRVPSRPAIALSPLDTVLAYSVTHDECRQGTQGSSCDSLFTYDVRRGTSTFRTLGEPLAFSPDGTKLLLYERPCNELQAPYRCQAAVLSLQSGQLEERALAAQDDEVFFAHWGATGIGLFIMRHAGAANVFGVLDADSGVLTEGYVVESEAPYATGWVDWSHSGAKIAVWSADPEAAYLNVADLSRGTVVRAAIDRSAPGGAMAFSGHGSVIAFVIGSRIYLRHL
jgi:hypothetical protein